MLRTNTFDGGTHGAVISAGSSGGVSGDAFDAIADLSYSNVQAFQGGLSCQLPASGTGQARWALSGERAFATREYFYITNAKTGDFLCGNLEVASAIVASRLINGANQLRIRLTGGNNVWTAAASFPLNQWVRVETLGTIGTTGSNGTMRVAYYLGNSTTPIEDSGVLTGLNMAGDTGTLANVRFGKVGTYASAGPDYLDAIAVATGADASGFIGPYSSPLGQPVVSVTGRTSPSTIGGSDGTTTLSWSAVTDADHYEVSVVDGSFVSPVDYAAESPTVLAASVAGTTYTVTGLNAGTRTFGVRAMPED